MHTIDIPLVQRTWNMVLPIADQAATLFYGKLFELDPSLKHMFRSSDMAEQRKKRPGQLKAEMNRYRPGYKPFQFHPFGPIYEADAPPKAGEPGIVSDTRFAYESWRYTSKVDDLAGLKARYYDALGKTKEAIAELDKALAAATPDSNATLLEEIRNVRKTWSEKKT